ncbi:MAG TPA: plastocyanin/azurin family copper-binding protein, partial [Microthrixaceae bacterium]|nr:plastocyanin/azurin family copper-binding protein [Microthrixaceae bacterium]
DVAVFQRRIIAAHRLDPLGRDASHNVLPDEEGDFKEVQVDELDPGMKASRTFDEVGEFGYYCSLHGTATKGMFGAIKVVE